MYNRINLPLSPRKVIKKSIGAVIGVCILFVFGVGAVIFSNFFYREVSKTQGFGSAWLFTACIGGLLIIYLFSTVLYQYYYYRLYDYEFKDDGGMIRKGVISRATGYVRYDRIQNVYVDQDFWDRIFGLRDVHYETAGEQSAFYSHVDGLRKKEADLLAEFLNTHAQRAHQPPAASDNLESGKQQLSGATGEVSRAASDIAEISSITDPLQRSVVWVNTVGSSMATWFVLLFATSGMIEDAFWWWLIFICVISTLVLVGWRWYYSVWYRNFQYFFGPDRGQTHSRVIGSTTGYLYYDRIQDVRVSQGIL